MSPTTESAMNPTLRRRRKDDAPPSSCPNPDAPSTTEDPDPAAKLKPVTANSQHSAADLKSFTAPCNLSVNLSLLDIALMTILLALSLAVRFYKLDSIQNVIFDEVHYLNFDNYILQGKYFFDVNPVFGKLVIAYFARYMGYDPDTPVLQLGEPLPSQLQAFAARAPAALFGALTVPVFYRVCRLLHLTTYASVLGSLFILFDSMHVTQSRIAMVDSVLVFYTCLSMMSALLLWNAKNVVTIKGRSVSMVDAANVFIFLLITGINCGLSVSVRWTAFATPALIFTISFFGIGPFCKEPLNILELLLLYGSAFVGYCGSFAIFLLNVNKSGPGDGFMTPAFQACLEGSAQWTGPEGCTMSLWARIKEVNQTIFRYSKGIRGNDKWGSSWFQWIINWRGALYYREQVQSKIAMIYVLMNPVMTICIDVLMCLFIAALFYMVRYRKHLRTTEAFQLHLRRGSALFFGWIGSMLPTMVVYRSGPVYQYLPGLFFAQALASVGFDIIPRKARPVAATAMTIGMILAFWYWSPWVYAMPLSQEDHIRRRWLRRWD